MTSIILKLKDAETNITLEYACEGTNTDNNNKQARQNFEIYIDRKYVLQLLN